MGKAALLRQKGYPPSLINEAYVKARDKIQDELLKPKCSEAVETPKKIYMPTTYNRAYDSLISQVKSIWDLLDRLSSTRPIHGMGLQVGYHRALNVCNLLVKSKLPSIKEQSEPTQRVNMICTNQKCRYYSLLNTEGHIISSVTGRKYNTKYNVMCNSNSLVQTV